MRTELVVVDPVRPDPEVIERAAELLRRGELVAFPTETVYGLGANALSEVAVAKIFAAKGRPSLNPLIVHVLDSIHAAELASEWPETAENLAKAFWPGPLSLVVRKSNVLPDAVTAGLDTVAIRSPENAVARAILQATQFPVAAPSANLSNRLSPTTAQHVLDQLDGMAPLILDAGSTSGGIESTVLDLTSEVPEILRPGPVAAEEIGKVLGLCLSVASESSSNPKSPGMLPKHYAPKTPLRLIQPDEHIQTTSAAMLITIPTSGPHQRAMPIDPIAYAQSLYSTLHTLDNAGMDEIVVELPPDQPEWVAVRDRLIRASGKLT